MGLDMYLSAKKYVSGYNYQRESDDAGTKKDVASYDAIVAQFGDLASNDSPGAYMEVTVCYWRKANAIHKWFVDNCQGGVDECQHSYVTREQLEKLRDLCEAVLGLARPVKGKVGQGTEYSRQEDGSLKVERLTKDGKIVANADEIATLLPTQSGFFFGSTDYDEYYVRDVAHTFEELSRILASEHSKGCDFYYHSSW